MGKHFYKPPTRFADMSIWNREGRSDAFCSGEQGFQRNRRSNASLHDETAPGAVILLVVLEEIRSNASPFLGLGAVNGRVKKAPKILNFC